MLTVAFLAPAALRVHTRPLSPHKSRLRVSPTRQAPRDRRYPRASVAARGNGVPDLPAPSRTELLPSPNFLPPEAAPQPERPVWRFLRLLLRSWRFLVPALLAAITGSACGALQPLLYGSIVDILASAHTLPAATARSMLLRRVARLVTAYSIEATSTWFYVNLVMRAVDRTTRSLRESVFASTLRNDVGFFDSEGRSEIVRNLSEQVDSVRNSIWDNLGRDRGLRAMLEVCMGLCVSYWIAGALGTPLFGVLVPLVSCFVAQMGMRNGRIAARMARKDADVRMFLDEKLRGMRTLKAFGAELRERRTLSGLLDKSENSAKQLGMSKAVTEAANHLAIYVTISTFFTGSGLLICAGLLTFHIFVCLSGFVWHLNFAMQGVSYSISDASKIATSLGNIYSLLDKAENYGQEHLRPSSVAAEKPFKVRGEVQFKDVGFHYPSRPDIKVLQGVSFAIKPGQMIALVGDSGGGKSTIAAILARFYQPTSGTVTLDGKDIQSIPGELYARQISVVDQDPVLFNGSVRENVAYGLPDDDIGDEAVIAAAKEANAHEFISKLQDGYDTVWTPGSNFSGGQRQRIAIARSLIKSPPILILDEATSALDQESERMVQSALERVMKGRSVLIIAHRLSTVRTADAILFVKNGRVVEKGTYEELLEKPNGHFRTLVKSATDDMESKTPSI